MKVALINQPLANRGDESAHKALISKLLSSIPDIFIDVIFFNEGEDRINEFVFKNERVKSINIIGMERARYFCARNTLKHNSMFFTYIHPLLNRYRKLIPKYDYIICAPGGICMGGFMNWFHVWQLYVAKTEKKKIIYWGRSIGPFSNIDKDHALFKQRSIELLNYFSYISLRDSISMKEAESLNVKCDMTVDSAFLERPKAIIPSAISEQIGDKYVVFVPNELTWHYHYSSFDKDCIDRFYLDIIKLLLEEYKDHRIVMLPQTYKDHINDYSYFVSLCKKGNNNDIIVINEEQGSDIQQAIISKSSFLVGARYHSIVFAINNLIPFLSLSYEHKMSGLLDTLNLSERQINIENIFSTDGSPVSIDIMREVKAKIKNRSSIQEARKKANEIVNNSFDRMLGVIEA